MRKKISVIGEGVQLASELSRAADIGDDLRGADVVVLAGDGDLADIARSAPAAVVVVVGEGLEGRCKEVYEKTLFPRARIIGIADSSQAGAAVESIIFESGEEHEVIAMTDGQFGPRSARLGRAGIRELLPPRTSPPAS